MLSQTLKVEEKKVSLVFWFVAQEPRYGHLNIGYFHKKCKKYIDFTGSGSGWKFFELIWFTTPNSKILLFLDFLRQYPMDPGEILRGHHISNFEKEITRDNRLNVNLTKHFEQNISKCLT